jgi:hypothetical protein
MVPQNNKDEVQPRGWVRLAVWGIGVGTNAAMNWAFDWVLYPYAIYALGLLWGGVVMSLASFVFCIILIWLYDLLKRDWLGIETVKSLREVTGQKGIRRIMSAILRRGDVAAFFLLSLYFDPFIATAYLRHGKFNGMVKRDWLIFVGSWALSNFSWIIACYLGIGLVEWLWQLVCW